MTALDDLRDIAERIRVHDAERDALVARRDALIDQASHEGATWIVLQEAAGLSPRGLMLVKRRLNRAAGEGRPR